MLISIPTDTLKQCCTPSYDGKFDGRIDINLLIALLGVRSISIVKPVISKKYSSRIVVRLTKNGGTVTVPSCQYRTPLNTTLLIHKLAEDYKFIYIDIL